MDEEKEAQVLECNLTAHSPEVSACITELLEYGAIGIEVAQIVDFIAADSVLLHTLEKHKLFAELLLLVRKITELETKLKIKGKGSVEVGSGAAEALTVLIESLEEYLETIRIELFLHPSVAAHIGILKGILQNLRKRNMKVRRTQAIQIERLLKKPLQ